MENFFSVVYNGRSCNKKLLLSCCYVTLLLLGLYRTEASIKKTKNRCPPPPLPRPPIPSIMADGAERHRFLFPFKMVVVLTIDMASMEKAIIAFESVESLFSLSLFSSRHDIFSPVLS